MNLNELWIGDVLRIKSTGLIGTFTGKSQDGLAVIKSGTGSIHNISTNDLEIYVEPQKPIELSFVDDPITSKLATRDYESSDSIDLHYDLLIQYHDHARGHILDFQLETCEEFIQKSITNKNVYIRIIHGKGEGILKKAVETLLKKYSAQISLTSAHYDGASIDVWFV